VTFALRGSGARVRLAIDIRASRSFTRGVISLEGSGGNHGDFHALV
jgi:hypothetical protein